jgi:hypothetical protein
MKRIRESNLLKTYESNQNESMDLQNESTFLRISYTIPASILYSQTCVKMCKMNIKDCFQSTMIMTLKCVK